MLRKKRLLWIAAAALVFLPLFYFSIRSTLFGMALDKLRLKAQIEWGIGFSVQDHGFEGWSTAWLKGVVLTPSHGDTLVKLDTVAFRPDLLSLLSGRPGISYLFLNNGQVLLNGSSHGRNIDFIHRLTKKSSAPKTGKATVFSTVFSDAINRVFALAPQQSQINGLSVQMKTDSFSSGISLIGYKADQDSISGEGEEAGTGKRWKLRGVFNQHKQTLSVEAYPEQADKRLPFLKEFIGAVAGFDTVRIGISGIKEEEGSVVMHGNCATVGFFAYHPKLATDTIRFHPSSFDYALRMGSRSVELDSSSRIRIGNMAIRPFMKYERSEKGSVYSAHLYIDTLKADDFFVSLPSGMFDEVRSIRADGRLAFSMTFKLDELHPTDVVFHCMMKKDGFRIRNFGTSGLTKLNADFVHDVYEKDRYIRSFTVGPVNPDFTPLSDVSLYFRNAVLTSEDGNFFFHNGFNEEAFRKSIADNYKAGKFVRGGSTITMQLVKNVFLTRKKTVARKAEEALIVWLIESCRLVSKERLLEVYFNIIELGPNIYGIGEASRFYFSKRPSQLSLNEGIFLASLLPRPKAYRYSFDSLGVLKPYLADYYKVMSNFMLKKSLITQEEHDGLLPQVKLIGPALDALSPVDSTGGGR